MAIRHHHRRTIRPTYRARPVRRSRPDPFLTLMGSVISLSGLALVAIIAVTVAYELPTSKHPQTLAEAMALVGIIGAGAMIFGLVGILTGIRGARR